MNAIETLAIEKLVGEKAVKEARTQTTPGMYFADFWVHVTGGMEVGDDYIRRVPQKAKPWDLLAVALSHMNGTTVESIVREALTADPKMVKAIKSKAEAAVVALKGTTETTCSGRIKADLKAEVMATTTALPKAA